MAHKSAPHIAVRKTHLETARKVANLTTDDALAKAMGVDPGTVSRVLADQARPGTHFIAALLLAFPGLTFDDLFTVVPGTDGGVE